MSSSQCLRRLAINPIRRPAPSLQLGLTSCRNTTRVPNGARWLYASYTQPKPASCPSSRTPSYITQTRQFSLSARYNEEKTVKTPEMAESITEGTLKGWNKSVGDYVEMDEEIGSIETDKIDVAINSPAAGTIKKFLVEAEATVEVGQDILVLELGGSPPAEGQQSSGQQEESSQQSQSSQGQKAPQAQSGGSPKDDSTPAMPPPETSKGQEQPKQTNIETSNQSQPSTQSSQQQQQDSSKMQQSGSPQPEPKGQQSSTQPKGQASSTQSKQQESSTETQSPYGTREERRVKMNRMRLRIAERLKQSQNTAASLTTFNEVDMSNLMEMRKSYKDEILNKTGIKFGFMGAFAMASILGMKAVPTVNASIEGPGGGDTIVYRDYVDVSVAVATEKGLVTPVVRNAESLDIIGIERAISDLGKKARDNKLTIEDMAGGTFTISNGGVFGSLMGTPIINLPQTAVLGLHAIKDKPVAINGKVEIRPMMYLALTYDHRLLDGREAVTFLVKIKEYIEDPRKMLLALP